MCACVCVILYRVCLIHYNNSDLHIFYCIIPQNMVHHNEKFSFKIKVNKAVSNSNRK